MMGNFRNVTLLLVGLDNSGKTTIARRLAGEPIDSVVPTVGFSVVTLRQKGCRVSLYDLGGGPQIRDIWHRYYADAHGVIFVVDAIAVERLEECRQVLQNLLRHSQISGKPILLLANKQDVDGALDEIDVVDHLNLEKLVNEQKCPTLVELCSALQFSKKIDIGIDNGYKWLIRGIIRDYPTLNNRVLRDLAKEEEKNKIHVIKRVRQMNRESEETLNHKGINHYENPFKPIKKIVDKSEMNGKAINCNSSGPRIPGLVDDHPLEGRLTERRIQRKNFPGKESNSKEEPAVTSYSSEFFLLDKFQSDLELLNDVSNQTFRNFLVRPKSSGARLYGVRPERKKASRRKPFVKRNKTGPNPFTDLAKDQKPPTQLSCHSSVETSTEKTCPTPVEKIMDVRFENGSPRESVEFLVENRNPFIVTSRARDRRKSDHDPKSTSQLRSGTRSTPNSRKGSGSFENAPRRPSSTVNSKVFNEFLEKPKNFPLKVNNRLNTKEILLDVTQLTH
ncbi:hypothetical protein RUM44_004053 [Polyplax serrata]|uniref:ADP-ribosylation factor-like protein 13B n=1 Tax=Polyplax serrata TaxID=468196 RepID=A0ABR1B1Q8_POLSC